MSTKLFHVKVYREYVTDYYPTQISCVHEGWTHAGSLLQAAHNIARKYGVSTKLKYYGDAEERFGYEEILQENPAKTKGNVVQISIFDDLDL